jgi:hypothetical protein
VSSGAGVERGRAALLRLLREEVSDLRTLDPPGLRRWLERRLARWRRDPLFAQRVRIRELRRSHPRLAALEADLRSAEAADRASPLFPRLQRVERELEGAAKAMVGLSEALRGADADRLAELRAKRETFRSRRSALAAERENLTISSPERQILLRLRAELEALRARSGLDREEAALQALQRERGRGSVRSGASFEDRALEAVRLYVLPELAGGSEGGAVPVVLTGVRLGAADTELDQVIVRPGAPGVPVEVLALVEAKRNPNDLGHGFRRRQENLAWLRGDRQRYDAERFRNRHFPTGHFDRAAVHRQGGEEFAIAAASFARLEPDPATGMVLRGLYLVTRWGALWGVSGAALARIQHRVATDPRWDPDDAAYLGELLRWCRGLAAPLEAPDVVRLYAEREEVAGHVLLLRPERSS